MSLRVFSISLFFSSLAMAYSPPASYVVDRVLKSREGFKTIEVDAIVTDLVRNVKFKESFYADFLNARYLVTLSDETGAPLASKTAPFKDLSTMGQIWVTFSYDPSPFRFRTLLESFRLLPNEKTETKLVRDGASVLWAWGNNDQIRIEKDEFRFGGFLTSNRNQILVKGTNRFPKTVLVRQRNEDRFLYEMKGARVNFNSKPTMVNNPATTDSVREWLEFVR